MKKFTVHCIDNKTRMQIILSDCSYNMACSYLDNNYFNSISGKVKVRFDARTNRYLIFKEDENKNIIGRVFVMMKQEVCF